MYLWRFACLRKWLVWNFRKITMRYSFDLLTFLFLFIDYYKTNLINHFSAFEKCQDRWRRWKFRHSYVHKSCTLAANPYFDPEITFGSKHRKAFSEKGPLCQIYRWCRRFIIRYDSYPLPLANFYTTKSKINLADSKFSKKSTNTFVIQKDSFWL